MYRSREVLWLCLTSVRIWGLEETNCDAEMNEDTDLVQSYGFTKYVQRQEESGFPAKWRTPEGFDEESRKVKDAAKKCKLIQSQAKARRICNEQFKSREFCDNCSGCRWKTKAETKAYNTEWQKLPEACYAAEYPWKPPSPNSYQMYPARWLAPKFKGRFQEITERQITNCQSIENHASAHEACRGFRDDMCNWCSACRFRNFAAKRRALPIGCYAREPPWWPFDKNAKKAKKLVKVLSKQILKNIQEEKKKGKSKGSDSGSASTFGNYGRQIQVTPE